MHSTALPTSLCVDVCIVCLPLQFDKLFVAVMDSIFGLPDTVSARAHNLTRLHMFFALLGFLVQLGNLTEKNGVCEQSHSKCNQLFREPVHLLLVARRAMFILIFQIKAVYFSVKSLYPHLLDQTKA